MTRYTNPVYSSQSLILTAQTFIFSRSKASFAGAIAFIANHVGRITIIAFRAFQRTLIIAKSKGIRSTGRATICRTILAFIASLITLGTG